MNAEFYYQITEFKNIFNLQNLWANTCPYDT